MSSNPVTLQDMINAVDVHLNIRLITYHTKAHDREKEVFQAILDLLNNNVVLRVS